MMSETNRLPAPQVANTDLALKDEPLPAVLDEIADLVFMEAMLREYVEDWKAKLEACQAKIQEAMGDHETATLNGKLVFTWKRIDRLNETALKKASPNLYQAFTHLVEVPKLDKDLFRMGQPELYREHQVRQFKRVD
jgi:hypothetical protein